MHRTLIPLALLPMLACYPNTREHEDSVAPSDTDSDTDTDADTDADTDTAPVDADRDGYSEANGDCDDADDAVHPGATEVCDNGKDDDCDGSAGACALTSRSLADADAKFTGEALGDSAAYGLSSAGDVNGDGFDDILVGAGYNDDGGWSAGTAYLLLGSVAPISRSLSDADAQLTGQASDDAGFSVSAAGDVNGDGFDDMLVSAHGNDDGGSAAGAAYLVLGSASPSSRSLSTADAMFTGAASLDQAGISLSTAGDVNGDGFDDVFIGALRAVSGSYAGAAYLVLGSAAPMSRSLSAADAQFTGEAVDDRAGTSVSTAGDVDGDGCDDMLVGAYFQADGGEYAGAAYLLLGSDSPASRSLDAADAQFTGEEYERAGFSVATAGDVNADGFDDVLVGAYFNGSGGTNAGATYLLLGSNAPTSLALAAADAKFTGEAVGDQAGDSVSTAGDVDSDGFDDVLIGAYTSYEGGAQAGAAYLVLGSTSPTSRSLSVADAQFTGEAGGDFAGVSVATAGDVDGDGFDDVLVGAYENDGGGDLAGAAYLIFGTGL